MEKLFDKTADNNEKGIALIFTLIVLGLLLILALAFALDSMFNQKSAYNAANASAAELLAKTQLKEIISLIENDEANYNNSELYSHDSSATAVTDPKLKNDMLLELLETPPFLPSGTVQIGNVNWNYIRSKDTDQRIIGRTAFIMLDNGIALNSLVNPEDHSTSPDIAPYDESQNKELRIGKNVYEINARYAIPQTIADIGNPADTALTAALNWQENLPKTGAGFVSGRYPGDWGDPTNLLGVLDAQISPTVLSVPNRTEISRNLSLNIAKDEEAFWADISGDQKVSSTELYKRYDLTRPCGASTETATESLNFMLEKILLMTPTGIDYTKENVPNKAMELWKNEDSDTTSCGFPWLAAFGFDKDGNLDSSLRGTFNTVFLRRCQIAANLKDYCDTNNEPTSNVDPKNWKTTAPDFTGNERTPYIDKVGVEVISQTALSNGADPGKFNLTVAVTLRVHFGLINMYGADYSNKLIVGASGTVLTEIDGVACTPKVFNVTCEYNSGDWSNGYSLFAAGTFPSTPPASDLLLQSANYINTTKNTTTVKVTKIVIDKVWLWDVTNNSGFDYVKTLDANLSSTTLINNALGLKYGFFGFAVHDPRQNLNGTNNDPSGKADWVILDSNVDSSSNPDLVFNITAVPRYGAPNCQGPTTTLPISPDAPGSDKDIENTSNDPANCKVSTAYIRNAPMESPWELGFIHRGARWQTINLTKYDADKAFAVQNLTAGSTTSTDKYIPGGGSYATGDANILDQIKMVKEAKSLQKVNLKTPSNTATAASAILEALLSKVNYGSTIVRDAATPANHMTIASIAQGGGTELTNAEVKTIALAISDKYKLTANPETRMTRASVVDKIALDGSVVAGLNSSNDAGREELIGKVINLTKICGNVSNFALVIVAQTIKDIGGKTSDISITKASVDESRTDEVKCRLSRFDAETTPANESEYIYGDEITAQKKILVKGYRATDGSVRITSFKFVE